ncbi:hypothetical protein G7Y79_00007g021790 [Physcia stellaris]|nr:hypothetical protein G7Y79_00007g021790 [Physcia stellaris]
MRLAIAITAMGTLTPAAIAAVRFAESGLLLAEAGVVVAAAASGTVEDVVGIAVAERWAWDVTVEEAVLVDVFEAGDEDVADEEEAGRNCAGLKNRPVPPLSTKMKLESQHPAFDSLLPSRAPQQNAFAKLPLLTGQGKMLLKLSSEASWYKHLHI